MPRIVSNSLFKTSKLTQERRAVTQCILSDWTISIHFPLILPFLVHSSMVFLVAPCQKKWPGLDGEDRGHGIASNPSSH
jgi:hypothetical protein